MAQMAVSKFAVIPYLSNTDQSGRFLCTLCFYDKCWHAWIDVADRLIKAQMWPAECPYFGTAPEAPSDICFHFLDLIAQRACFSEIGKPFIGLQDDIYNLSASLAKIRWLYETKATIGSGVSRMAATEIEYIFSICRSIFDLLQEIVFKLWERVTPRQPTKAKKTLKTTYSDTLLFKGLPSDTEKLIQRFAMPSQLADCYVRSTGFFMALRKFRDNVVHRGSQIQLIFEGDDGFLIRESLVPFAALPIWRSEEKTETRLVPLFPALGYVVSETLAVCEDFSMTIERLIDLLPPTAPGMHLFMRGYFNEVLISTLEDIKQRVHEE